MIKNYITIALRHFRRNLSFTLINVVGLSLGLAGSFVIGSWVWQELSYDSQFQDSQRIYRVSVSFYNSGAFASGPEVLNNTLAEQAPEVEIATRLAKGKSTEIYINESSFEESPYFVDSSFFQTLLFPFIAGNPSTAMSSPSNVVITASLAMKYFGSTDVLGKTILVGKDKISHIVSGVIKESSTPSHFQSQMWLPLELKNSTNWTSARYFNYIKLKEGSSKSALLKRLADFKMDLVYPAFNAQIPYEEWAQQGMFDFHVVALQDIHLDPPMRFELSPGGNRANVYIFLAVAIFLVAIASINFVNLSTAQSAKRAREVGVRKTLGTSRGHLVFQYLTESMVMSFIALLLGVGMAEIFLILFQNFTNEHLLTGLFNNGYEVALYLLFGLLVGVFAGIYPAFYLSKFKPVDILKSQLIAGKSGGFRNILVVIQFTISVALIICSLVVYEQLQLLRNVDLGFNRENILVVNNVEALSENKSFFRDKLLQHSEAKSASFNKRIPAGTSLWVYTFKNKSAEQGEGFQTFIGDDQYLPTMGFRMLEGRNFSKDIASDSTAVILTESAAKKLLLKEPIAGTELADGMHVVGVVSDFSFQNFYEKPDPVVIVYDPDGYRLSVRLAGHQTASFIKYMQNEWQALSPDQPMNYSFVDDNFELLLEKEKTLGKTITFFTSIAIFISCLGLFGLAAFMAQQRKKEIGVRRVFGASVKNVILLLNTGFTKLVLISILISIPLAWYLMDWWLQNFEFKTTLNVYTFLLSGVSALFIAWFTVSYLSFKAASVNPVESLRDE
ncbi:MAG TPA: ABC transporter permease [Fulvivirga sp.]|nr:ABC transporter permease [Fulvivirga sp.]